MATAAVIAFSTSDLDNASVLGVFTRQSGTQPKCWTFEDGEVLHEAARAGQNMSPSLEKALRLSSETQTVFSLTQSGIVTACTHEEYMRLPAWVVEVVSATGDLNPV